jgi:Tol biopolymer transport system component
VAWSPDGSKLVYSMQGSLWVQALDSTNARQVTAGPGYDYQPDWSPDGRTIVFTRYLHDAMELQLLDIDSSKVRRLTETDAVNVEPRWSPDGAKVGVPPAPAGFISAGFGLGFPGKPAARRKSATRESTDTNDHEPARSGHLMALS